MKKVKILFLLFVATMIATTGLISCDKTDDPIITDPPSTTLSLSEEEMNMLQFMREEEKLARDVYQYFFDKYGLNIFKNIKSSEQTHTSAVLTIMNQYNVPDIAATTPGVFNNAELQELYNALIAQGNASVSAALIVGATIEDVDIRDLRVAVTTTTKTDIIDMYKRLECASDNHLRAFTNNLNITELPTHLNLSPQLITLKYSMGHMKTVASNSINASHPSFRGDSRSLHRSPQYL